MAVSQFPKLFLIRDPQPIGNYVRPGARDYRHLADYLSAGWPAPTGIVLDARVPHRIEDVLKACHASKLEIVLDPLSIELTTAGGFARSGMANLPWAPKRAHRVSDFNATTIREVAEHLAETAVHMGATAVLAPTHVLDTAVSPWLPLDLELTTSLRQALNDRDGYGVGIYYPLVGRLKTLSRGSSALSAHLEQLTRTEAVNAIWLRADGFDVREAGPTQLRRYVDVARSLHRYGLPVVAERTGVLGMALAAFGAVAGFESGIGSGQRYKTRELAKLPSGGPVMQPLRVYLPSIGAFMNRSAAETFLKHPAVKNWFICQDRCCRNGVADMIGDPRKHFLTARSTEVERMAAVPPELRANHYLESWLRPASDRATRAARVMEQLRSHRDRLDSWRVTLSEILEKDQVARPTTSPAISQARQRGA